jgi:hypothetical protein
VDPRLPELHGDGFPLPRVFAGAPNPDYALADEALAWIDQSFPGPKLLPFQRFILREGLATVNGRLWGRRVVVRMARQQGKTFGLRRLFGWRLQCGESVFGGVQRLLNTHPDAQQAVSFMTQVARGFGAGRRGSQGGAYWASTHSASWYPGNVQSDEESAWYSRAMKTAALTGQAGLSLVYVDELQDARRKEVQEALGGTMSGARVRDPQVWYSGTGQKPGSDLLELLRSSIGSDGLVWLEWSAPPGMNAADARTWRWASPDWSDAREAYLLDQQAAMPGVEFAANYLLSDEALSRKWWVDRDVWDNLAVGWAETGRGFVWRSAGVEQDFNGARGPVVAFAGALADGRVLVSVRRSPSKGLGHVVGWVAESGVSASRVGASMLDRGREFAGLSTSRGVETDASAAGELLRWVADGRIVHEGSGLLYEVVRGMESRETLAGPVARCAYPEVVKAAVWALREVAQPAFYVV